MPLFGADAASPATAGQVSLATRLLGAAPSFFGRYFSVPHSASSIQYQSAQENPVLHRLGVRVLCIARQTNHVGGGEAEGAADAANNMAAIVASFGANYLAGLGFDPIVFLDTELGGGQPSLNASYYAGWAGALQTQGPVVSGVRLRFTPAIYINGSDKVSWAALASAMAQQNAACHGAWVANYGKPTGAEGPPAWAGANIAPSAPVPPPCPIVAWQYADYKEEIDLSLLPPGGSMDAVVKLMILPPAV
jgi:hypothetical protein